MKETKPVIELDSLLDWIRCPMRIYWRKKKTGPVFDYGSLLRFMLLNTLKAEYREAGSALRLDPARQASDIWEYLLNLHDFPNPAYTVRKMIEFYSLRTRCLEQIKSRYSDSTGLLDLSHWWSIGLIFDPEYYRLRDEINAFQHLLGFPDWETVKTYLGEAEFHPFTLADTFCDYMSGVNVFSVHKIPETNIRFNAKAYLDLEDITLEVRFDILWRRERAYKKNDMNLKPGLVAEQLVPNTVFTGPDQVLWERIQMRDIRLPLIGVIYRDENGDAFRLDSLTCITLPVSSGTSSWKETGFAYDRTAREQILSDLNCFGQNYLYSEKQKLFIPNSLIVTESCASCSFLKDCLDKESGSSPKWAEEADMKTAALFSSFWTDFEEKLQSCENRTDAMDCLIEAFRFLKENPSPRLIGAVSNAAENMKQDLAGKKKGDLHAKA